MHIDQKQIGSISDGQGSFKRNLLYTTFLIQVGIFLSSAFMYLLPDFTFAILKLHNMSNVKLC